MQTADADAVMCAPVDSEEVDKVAGGQQEDDGSGPCPCVHAHRPNLAGGLRRRVFKNTYIPRPSTQLVVPRFSELSNTSTFTSGVISPASSSSSASSVASSGRRRFRDTFRMGEVGGGAAEREVCDQVALSLLVQLMTPWRTWK